MLLAVPSTPPGKMKRMEGEGCQRHDRLSGEVSMLLPQPGRVRCLFALVFRGWLHPRPALVCCMPLSLPRRCRHLIRQHSLHCIGGGLVMPDGAPASQMGPVGDFSVLIRIVGIGKSKFQAGRPIGRKRKGVNGSSREQFERPHSQIATRRISSAQRHVRPG